ncbi:LysR family transcriptional regulator [Caulobacter sp. KR2-114]|uniref:LysR family transcriptional regulator n=1 Tax=Caulobacter sp. KR2-114 TaxID=3400912 RepID=UPI003C12AA43
MADFDLNKIRRLDGTLLLVLRELLRRRQAQAVAQRLGLSASAISHALGRLRELFEDPLFIRRPHGLEPTRRALELAPRIEALLQLADSALSPEGGFEPARSDRWFAIGASEYVAVLVGGPLLQMLRAEAPGVAFTLTTHSHSRTLDALRRGELDLALGRFGPPPPGVVAEPLFEDEYAVVARRGHPRIQGTMDLDAYVATGHIFSAASGENSTEEPVPDRRAIATLAVVPRWLTALSMAAVSDALVTCPRRLAERQAPLLGLQVLTPPFAQKPFTVHAMRREGPDPAVDWLLEKIRTAVSD